MIKKTNTSEMLLFLKKNAGATVLRYFMIRFGGTLIYVPKWKVTKKGKIISMRARGYSITKIIRMSGACWRYVYRVLQEQKLRREIKNNPNIMKDILNPPAVSKSMRENDIKSDAVSDDKNAADSDI